VHTVEKKPIWRHFKSTLRTGAFGTLAALTLVSCADPSPTPGATVAATASKAALTQEPESYGTVRRLRLVTTAQYLNTVAYIFGPDVRPDANFVQVQRTDGLLQVGTSAAGVTDAQMEKYQAAASLVVAAVADPVRREFVIPCKPANEKAADHACAAEFLSHVGRLFYRRPLSPAKLDEIVSTADGTAKKFRDFYAGISVALEGMLVSPKGLFVEELAEPDPARPGHMRLDAYSLASRLSLFLWNAGPDEALLKAAESGELHTAKGRARVVDMMLASPRLEAGVRAFFDDMFGFDGFDNLAKDPLVYKSFTAVTAEDAREQTLRTVIDHLLTKKRDYRDLVTTRDTFISPALATLYRVPAPKAWVPYTFPSGSPQAGVLTQVSFLALHSHPGRSSPTVRGKALREVLLCQKVPAPPVNVDFTLINNPSASYPTARDRLTEHRSNPVCAGCHKVTDPMGLALENFDGAGRYRAEENGTRIDASGALDGKEFKDVVGLGQALRDHPALTSCLVKRAYGYSVARPTTPDDRPFLDYLNAGFAAKGYRLPELLRTIALSSTFAEVHDAPETEAKTAGVWGITRFFSRANSN